MFLETCSGLCLWPTPGSIAALYFPSVPLAEDRQKLDIEYFSKLLEKILEVQKNRKKLNSLAEKNSPRKKKRNSKGMCPFVCFHPGRNEMCVTVRQFLSLTLAADWSASPPTGKKAAEKLSDIEEDDEDDMPDLEGEEEEGEKENEDLCNDGGSLGPKPKRKRKRARESGEQGAAPFFFLLVFPDDVLHR